MPAAGPQTLGVCGRGLGSATATTPYAGHTLYLAGSVVRVGRTTLDGAGRASFAIPITPGMVGTETNYQALFRDSQASAGLGLTHALHVDFCP